MFTVGALYEGILHDAWENINRGAKELRRKTKVERRKVESF